MYGEGAKSTGVPPPAVCVAGSFRMPAAASTLLGIRVITLPVFRPDYTGRRITSDEYAGLVVGCAVGGVAALALLGLGVRHALRRAQVRPAVQKRPAELEAAQQSWE